MKTEKRKIPENVNVEMLVDQQSPYFGERWKGEQFTMKTGLAKLLEGRGLLKILKEKVKNGDE